MKLFKGIIHVHSNYSYDGRHSLEEIAQYGIRSGFSFIGMSEHSDTLNEEKMDGYVKECQRISNRDCLMIPGIEFTCENDLHIIGLGVKHYIKTKDPIQAARFIQKNGGIAIIAHPVRYHYKIQPDLAEAADGIEVWNTAYDGRFVPNIHSMTLLRDLNKNGRSLLGFGGEDLHQIRDRCSVALFLSMENLREEGILSNLRQGNYRISNSYFSLSPGGETSGLKLMQIGLARRLYQFTVEIRNRWLRTSLE